MCFENQLFLNHKSYHKNKRIHKAGWLVCTVKLVDYFGVLKQHHNGNREVGFTQRIMVHKKLSNQSNIIWWQQGNKI